MMASNVEMAAVSGMVSAGIADVMARMVLQQAIAGPAEVEIR